MQNLMVIILGTLFILCKCICNFFFLVKYRQKMQVNTILNTKFVLFHNFKNMEVQKCRALKTKFYFIMQLGEGGELFTKITQNGKIWKPQEEDLKIFLKHLNCDPVSRIWTRSRDVLFEYHRAVVPLCWVVWPVRSLSTL